MNAQDDNTNTTLAETKATKNTPKAAPKTKAPEQSPFEKQYKTAGDAAKAATKIEGNAWAITHDVETGVWRIVDMSPKTKRAGTPQNIRRESAAGVEHPTKRVWAIAAEMYAKNKGVTRADVLKQCDAEGIATFTARTQFQRWRVAQANVEREQAGRAAQAKAKREAAKTEKAKATPRPVADDTVVTPAMM